MSEPLSESQIVSEVARGAAKRMTRKTIAALQGMKQTLSGDDSKLENAWDDLCVQIQYEDSFFRSVYDDMVRDLLLAYVAELPRHERSALWLKTDAGIRWECEEANQRDPAPICDDDIARYLAEEYVLYEAGRWSNAKIRAYIERAAMRD